MDYSLQADEIRELQRRKKFYEDNPPMWSKHKIQPAVEYTDEERESFEYERFMQHTDNHNTYNYV